MNANVVICAYVGADQPLRPGRVGGFKCIRCKKELQATPTGAKAIREGGHPLCNDCGFLLVKYRNEKGKQTDAILGPEFIREFLQRN